MAHPALAVPNAVVCIAGPVGSGKSTLADRLTQATRAVRISTDDYLPDYERTPKAVRDEPHASHLHELAAHVNLLMRGQPASIPVWSFHEHRRTGVRAAEPAELIVIEGIHALHASLDAVRSVGVLVHASPRTRWARWEILESTGQRGWGVDKAKAYFESIADPTFMKHRPMYESRAHFVVKNDQGFPRAD